MRRQRPPLRSVGAVASVGLLLTTTSCSGAVEVDAPTLSGDSAQSCRQLVDALPDKVADQSREEVEPKDAYAAAWGHPAIVLRCGVPKAKGFDRFALCQVTNGVGWFIPESQQTGQPVPVTMTTVGRAQNVEVTIPEEYFPPANAMVDLAPAIKQTILEVEPCV